MSSLPSFSECARKAIFCVLLVAVVGTGVPVIEVHAHDDASFGHTHDAHHHSHDLVEIPNHDGSDNPESADEDTKHAHAVASVALGLTTTTTVDISIPAYGRSPLPPPASRPPDKPFPPLYRPPIA